MIAKVRAGFSLHFLVGLLLLAAFLMGPEAVAAQGEGVIEGQVTLAGEESLPAGLQVELLFLPNGQGPPTILSQPLAGDGSFRFTELDSNPQHRYLVRVEYEGEEQYSDLIAFEPGESTQQVTLQLFARTTDAGTLSLPQVSFFLDVRSDGWLVAALYRFQNSGERTIVNLTSPPAFIPVPEEATNMQISDEVAIEGIVEQPDGFSYSGPFPPGDSTFLLSYLLPYEAGSQRLTLPLAMPAGVVRVLVPEVGQRIEAENLTSAGSEEIFEGRTFETFVAEGVPAGETFTLQMSELPPPPTPAPSVPTDSPTLPAQPRVVPISPLEQLPWWAPLVPVALVVLSVALYLYARPTPSSAEQRATLRERRDALVAEIAALDIRFEAGSIGEQTHNRQRRALKQELKGVLRQLSASAGSD